MAQPSALSQTVGLLVWLGLVLAAAAAGAVASADASSFYAQLARPGWAPPAPVFAPVWSALYVLMALAAWLVWRECGPRQIALALFVLQLIANALWSWFFFAWQSGAFAMVDVLVLLVLVAATTAMFWRISRPAAVLMLPYLAWVCLASALTWSVWQRNPQLL